MFSGVSFCNWNLSLIRLPLEYVIDELHVLARAYGCMADHTPQQPQTDCEKQIKLRNTAIPAQRVIPDRLPVHAFSFYFYNFDHNPPPLKYGLGPPRNSSVYGRRVAFTTLEIPSANSHILSSGRQSTS